LQCWIFRVQLWLYILCYAVHLYIINSLVVQYCMLSSNYVIL